jgi:hypothetical protein
MSQITRSWLSFAAIGAGIVHLALVVSSPLPLAVVMLLLGVSELAWAATVLIRDRLVLPRVAQVAAFAPVILWSLLVVGATLLSAPRIASTLPFIPMGIGAIFELFIAGVLSVQLRRIADAGRTPQAPKAPSAVRYLSAVILGGLLVGALATPALANTSAGAVAMEHGGTMGGMMNMNMPGMGH